MRKRDAKYRRNEYRGAATSFIHLHRGIARVDKRTAVLVRSALLALVLFSGWLLILPYVGLFWGYILAAIKDTAGLPGNVLMYVDAVGPLTLNIPFLDVQALPPTAVQLIASCVGVALVFVFTFFLSEHNTPLSYFLRAMCFVQLTAIIFFIVRPMSFPYTSPRYMLGMTLASTAIATVIPIVLGGMYYIFDFGIRRKLAITTMMLAYMVVLIPFKYAAQSFLLWKLSLVYLPLFYLMGGIPLDIFALIALYSWGMSWRSRTRIDSTTPIHNEESDAIRAHKIHRDPIRHAESSRSIFRRRTQS